MFLRSFALSAFSGFLVAAPAAVVQAQVQTVEDPRTLVPERATVETPPPLTPGAPGQRRVAPPEPGRIEPPAFRSSDDPGVDLYIRMLPSRIWNPNTRRFDQVSHRGYSRTGAGTPGAEALNAYHVPPIEARPGETVRINIRNQLPPEPGCDHDPALMNFPDRMGCRNDTNNHFHGGWVNPEGNSDNVLRILKPDPVFIHEYEYNIPHDHPAGTFWYHPHVHGSTAIQVGSGMAGALIVYGDRWPAARPDGSFRPGDVDVLLRDAEGRSIPDRVFLLQQIQYSCDLAADGSPKPPAERWNCAEGETGGLNDYTAFLNPGPQWDASARFTTVNGAVASPLAQAARAGQPERWRFIHGGFSASANVRIFPRKRPETLTPGVATLFQATAARDQQETVDRECATEGEPLPMFEIAADGLTRPSILRTDSREMHPGYRSDVLVSFPQPEEGGVGEYCVIDAGVGEDRGVPGSHLSRRLLFTVTVEPADQPVENDPEQAIRAMLAEAAEASESGELAARIQADLAEMKLTLFTPHASLAEEEVDNHQHVRFNLLGSTQAFPEGLDPPVAQGAGIAYEKTDSPASPAAWEYRRFTGHESENIELTLGDTDEWRLTTNDVLHPFHIHVNPFEIIAANLQQTAPDGTVSTLDLTQTPTYLDAAGVEQPSHYFGMKGVFKDTILTQPGVTVVVRSHYRRYVGAFVLHCHILYHEDGGMMRKVVIRDPGHVAHDLGGGGGGHGGHGGEQPQPQPPSPAESFSRLLALLLGWGWLWG
ncbi:multicopper oxidase family protein [Neomegalonema sp.]|uniref:multicopper oxidase family protein n=1 Tax=Neomegalonema sp. TaxID=2039713 RepID=UPI00260C32E5|nr:multicopper oxidase domain-containing protein [Neomegalonema sp.]MDD2868332.1 multicopper oxidase domain-containing protein [Neomegalonema sp.]